ncbi:HetP family heterocyst commitment protein [Leptodesmis sichuanensis]|uniref:HetP family heterocyst commitment protein n=1 Tax=Leptodesmis sichuanensis TaxID=2906798 RepID=UPI001F284EA5|nr:HetP family heterocyst commitment protein [Leptodesmis sichuanensis]UIE38735.1 HetP family heterocyst commitment protein [Leptodesmis sichuanensis A121]
MNYQTSYSETTRIKVDKVMEADQFAQVVEAILAGKYSWACVLILRFAGYNPLHYIPYRTYNRLIKDNMHARSSPKEVKKINKIQKSQKEISPEIDQEAFSKPHQKPLHQIQDLAYLEAAHEQHRVVGGYRLIWLKNWLIG